MNSRKASLMSKHLAALPPAATKPYFKIQEVAELLGKSYPTVKRRIESLHIPLFIRGTNSRTKYIKFEDIDKIKELGDEYHPC